MAVRTEPARPTWHDGRVTSWLVTLDHKRIGILYIVTAFFFFFAAGVMALLMRAQLAQADHQLVGGQEQVGDHGRLDAPDERLAQLVAEAAADQDGLDVDQVDG